MSKRVVVIGGSAAGMSAASVAKRRDPDLVVTVFEQGHAISYSACGMPYRLGGGIERAMKDLVVLTPEEARKRKGIDVRTRTRVTRVDAKARKVWWRELDERVGHQGKGGGKGKAGQEGEEEYDELVIATGARAREAVPVSPAHGVFSLRSLDDGVALEAWLKRKEKAPSKAVVVGAGLIGVEVSEALRERGLEVTLVNRSRHVLSSMLDEELADVVAGRLENSGIRFITGKAATGWVAGDGTVHQVKEARLERSPVGRTVPEGEKRQVRKRAKKAVRKVASSSRASPSSQDPESQSLQGEVPDGAGEVEAVLLEGEPVPADVVVVSTGIVADGSLARQAGCRVREDGSVMVDDRMRTGVEGVWACGDCVAFPHRLLDAPMFLPLALHANRSGRIVGMNLTGSEKRFPGVLGTTLTRFDDLEMASTGITRRMAERAGLDVVVGDAKSMTQAAYMPGDHEVAVRMVAERATGRLLGVQMVGARGSALRIDAAVAMIWKGATLEEVEEMDLAYNPPFSPVWDPLAITARLTERERAPRGR